MIFNKNKKYPGRRRTAFIRSSERRSRLGKAFLFAAIALTFTQSCKKFIEVQPSATSIQAVSVFEDYATASAALTDIYSKIRDRGLLHGSLTGLPFQLANYTDETVSYQSISSSSAAFYFNRLLPTTSVLQEFWNVSYNQIYAANSVIEGTQNSIKLSEAHKKQLQGEATFIRALIHFYLVNLFGDVPYIVETDYRKNSTVSRMATAQIYEKLITDLQNAASMLPETYTPAQRVRPNKYVCRALMARVYLYNNQNAEAASEASALINQPGLFSLEPSLDNVFLISSKEAIWQLQSAAAGANTNEAATYIFIAAPPTVAALSNNLINSFEATDGRKSKWTKSVSNATATWYHAFKYKERSNTPASKEYSIVFRLAEQYLIRAEARAQQGDLSGARQDLDKIRTRGGLNPTTAQTKAEIINAILQERRWEFFTEFGHRFFDLKRLGVIDATLSPLKPGWNSTDRLLPIPQGELNTNPNLLPQNPGY